MLCNCFVVETEKVFSRLEGKKSIFVQFSRLLSQHLVDLKVGEVES